MDAPKSPGSIKLRGKANPGPRLGRRGLAVVVVIVLVVLGLLIFNVESRKQVRAAKPKEEQAQAAKSIEPASATAKAFNAKVSDEVVAVSDAAAQAAPTLPAGQSQGAAQPQAAGQQVVPAMGGTTTVPPLQNGAPASLTPEQQAAEAQRQQREADLKQALNASMQVQNWNSPESGQPSDTARAKAPEDVMAQALAEIQKNVAKAGASMPSGNGSEQEDPNQQKRKREFVETPADLNTPVLATTRKAPLSQFELNSGTNIRLVTLQAANSDLPGEMCAMVTAPVYNSATLQWVLIPPGTKFCAKYDSVVAYGQSRLLTCWHRAIFPDGSTLELGCMTGADIAGAAGFEDQVNNHYARILGFGVATSLFSAAFQLSQPQSNSPNGQLSNQQTVASAVGQQVSQLGMEVTRRNLNIQPTIRIRPGYRFTITLNKDVVFDKPYAPMSPQG